MVKSDNSWVTEGLGKVKKDSWTGPTTIGVIYQQERSSEDKKTLISDNKFPSRILSLILGDASEVKLLRGFSYKVETRSSGSCKQ